jgi:hypothetical protein
MVDDNLRKEMAIKDTIVNYNKTRERRIRGGHKSPFMCNTIHMITLNKCGYADYPG